MIHANKQSNKTPKATFNAIIAPNQLTLDCQSKSVFYNTHKPMRARRVRLKRCVTIPLMAAILISGCTTTPSTITQTDQASSDIVYEAGQLNEESLLDLITAELAGQNQDYPQAQQLYFRQAQLTQNLELAERATRLAQYMRDVEKVTSAASLWQELAPDNRLPTQLLLNIYLSESLYEQAFELIERQDILSDETLGIIEKFRINMGREELTRLNNKLKQMGPKSQQQLSNLLLQARILRQLNDQSEAVKVLDYGLSLEPLEPNFTLDKARIIAMDLEAPKEALRLINESLEINPTARELRAFQIRLLLELDPSRVDALVQQAIEDAENDPQLMYYYALLMLENQQLETAETWVDELIKKDPDNKDMFLYKGIIEQSRGNNEAAMAAFSQVERGDPLLNAFSRTLTLLPSPSSLEDLQARLDQAVKQDPENIEQLSKLAADHLIQDSQTEAAITLLTQQLSIVPQATSLLYTRGLAYEKIDTEKMLADLTRALALDEDNASLKNALGYSLLIYGEDFETAYELIKDALAANPDDPAIIDSMGWALFQLERFDEALTYIQRAYDIYPDPEVAKHLIQVLLELNRPDEARSVFDLLLAEHSENSHTLEAAQWFK